MWLTEDFKLEEFKSRDTDLFPLSVINNLYDLAVNLQELRDRIKTNIYINSGYRSKDHNKKVGGSPNSQHLKGKAADIRCHGISPNEIKDRIEDLIENGVMDEGGIGIYDTFVHYDIRGVKARWDYRTRK